MLGEPYGSFMAASATEDRFKLWINIEFLELNAIYTETITSKKVSFLGNGRDWNLATTRYSRFGVYA